MRELRDRGAAIVPLESQADLCIVDDARKNGPAGERYYSYKFVEESLKNNVLQDPEIYAVAMKSAVDRKVGSSAVAPKGSRTAFSRQDDQILYNWLEPFRQSGGKWKGNEIYKQLARQYPHHTYQSWRSRYMILVSRGAKMTVTEQVNPFPEAEDNDVAFPQERSPKRRRLDAPSPSMREAPQSPLRKSAIIPPEDSRRSSAVVEQVPRSLDASVQRSEIIQTPSKKAVRLDGQKEVPAALQSLSANRKANTPAAAAPSATLLPGNAERGKNVDKHNTPEENELSDADQSGQDAGSELASDSDSVAHTQSYFSRQAFKASETFMAVSKQWNFTRAQVQGLYRAVPDIQQTSPRKLDQSWENVANEWGHHTADEWRSFYQTVILPEYMRRNELVTKEDLNEYVNDLLAKEQGYVTPRRAIKTEFTVESRILMGELRTNGIGADDRANTRLSPEESSPHAQKQIGDDAPSGSDQSPIPQRSPAAPDHQGDPGQIGASKSRPKDIRESRAADSAFSIPLPDVQGSQVSPKKRLFGRTLDSDHLNLQQESLRGTVNPLPPDESPSGPALINTSALLNSQLVSSSRQPPESAQRLPESVCTSQESETVVAYRANPNDLDVNVITESDRTLDNAPPISSASRSHSPALNLLSDEIEQEETRFSPVPSDTGSEYIAFETAPERSQLWDPGKDSAEVEASEGEEEISTDDRQAIQDHGQDDVEQRMSGRHAIQHATPPISDVSPPQSHGSEDRSVAESQFEGEGSPELAVPTIPNRRVSRHIETQNLFEEVGPIEEDNTTIFDLPPPEGGWGQLGDLEDESEEVRVSVEVTDNGHLEAIAAFSSSQTEETLEERSEVKGPADSLLNNGKALSVFGGESDSTDISGNGNDPLPDTELRQENQGREGSSTSDGSDGTRSPRRSLVSSEDDVPSSSEESSDSAVEDHTIALWISDQSAMYSSLHQLVFSRLASTALQATVLNLSAATFTLRDLVTSFEESEAKRKADFDREIRMKREHTDGSRQATFKPRTKLTEQEARMMLPKQVFGVWTIEDDREFLSQDKQGIERVERKHGAAGVRKRAKFLRTRYGLEGLHS